MRKLTYLITEGDESYSMVFITNRTPQWTEEQFLRHRMDCMMVLIDDLPTEETEPTSYKLD